MSPPRNVIPFPQIEWNEVQRGSERQVKRAKQEWKASGHYTRVRNHGSYWSLELGEPKPYNLDRKER